MNEAAICVQRVVRKKQRNALLNGSLRARAIVALFRKIQSLYRMKRIIRRYNLIRSSTLFLQKWARCTIMRQIYKKTLRLILMVQCCYRRNRALQRVHDIKTAIMIEAAMRANHAARNRDVLRTRKHICNGTMLCPLGGVVEHVSNRKTSRREKILIGYDISCDLSDYYPDGWLYSTASFCNQLRHKDNMEISMMAVGGSHTILCDEAGNVYSFGIGEHGQLCKRTRKNDTRPTIAEQVRTYIESLDDGLKGRFGMQKSVSLSSMQSIGKMKIDKIVCGQEHVMVLTASSNLITWGGNTRGQLGLGPRDFRSIHQPRKIAVDHVTQIFCGQFHSVCLTGPGVIYSWGAKECIGNKYPGPSDFEDCPEPKRVKKFSSAKIKECCCGDSYTIVKSGSYLYSWGKTTNGQLGRITNPRTEPAAFPHNITLPDDVQFNIRDNNDCVLVSSGKHTMLMVANERVFAWGWSRYGQIGNGSREDCQLPTEIIFSPQTPAPASSSSSSMRPASPLSLSPEQSATETSTKPFKTKKKWIRNIVCGRRHSFMITNDDQIFVWGSMMHFASLSGKGNFVIQEVTGIQKRDKGMGTSDVPCELILNPDIKALIEPGTLALESISSSQLSMSSITINSHFSRNSHVQSLPSPPRAEIDVMKVRKDNSLSPPRASLSASRGEKEVEMTKKSLHITGKFTREKEEEALLKHKESILLEKFRSLRHEKDILDKKQFVEPPSTDIVNGIKKAAHKAEMKRIQEKRQLEGKLTDDHIESLFAPKSLTIKEKATELHLGAPKPVAMKGNDLFARNEFIDEDVDDLTDKFEGRSIGPMSAGEMRGIQAMVHKFEKGEFSRGDV
jgi:alpha-tubulin suppressor-like RCC1 family protein